MALVGKFGPKFRRCIYIPISNRLFLIRLPKLGGERGLVLGQFEQQLASHARPEEFDLKRSETLSP